MKYAILLVIGLSLILSGFSKVFDSIPLKKDNQPISKIELPASAPSTPRELEKLLYPDPLSCCDLDFKSRVKGKFRGPDGGEIFLWKKGNWQWKRSDGYTLWEGGGLLTLKNETHKILAWRKDFSYQWIKRSEIHFPDSSVLSRWWNKKWEKWMYMTKKEGKEFLIIEKGEYLPQEKSIGKYAIHFKKEYEKFIDIFFDSYAYGELVRLLKKDFGSQTSYSIPVLFFETLDEFGGFLQEKKTPHEGGRGNKAFVAVCCKKSYDKVLNRVKDEETAKRSEQFSIMLHEMTHSILAHGCALKSKTAGKRGIYPGLAFNEGIAEWAVATVNPTYRTFLFKQNYKKINSKKFPEDYQSMDTQSARARFGYHPMFWFWYYMEETFGRDKINIYHTGVCSADASYMKKGKTAVDEYERKLADDMAKSIFGKSRDELFEDMKRYYTKNQSRYESLYPVWNKENLDRFKK